jgi:hypothetical protein
MEMTHFTTTLTSRLTAALLTVVFSAVTVLGAVGPAYTGSNASHQVATTLANNPGESANSLA